MKYAVQIESRYTNRHLDLNIAEQILFQYKNFVLGRIMEYRMWYVLLQSPITLLLNLTPYFL